MSGRFLLGCVTGAYIATYYDLSPYFDYVEEKIKSIELKNKEEEKRNVNKDWFNIPWWK